MAQHTPMPVESVAILWANYRTAYICRWETIVNGLDTKARPRLPWVASDGDWERMKAALDLISRLISPSAGGGSRLRRLFDIAKKSRTHTYFMLAGPIGLILIELCTDMQKEQKAAFKAVLYVCSLLYEKRIDAANLPALSHMVVKALCLVEKYLCCSELDIKMHNVLHFASRISDLGPCWTTAMWCYEAMWSTLW
jgi:hypothetical protein